ncbi:squalene/phytoene synthase family protein [Shimia sp.]|uniref:squalene/phytoene synthase family protein n=1 Tax=Shimia sp. TaxID=1954381 RepID=UPI003B8DE1D8
MSDEDLKACAGIVKNGDPDRFAATMAAHPDARDVLFPLYAFNVEVSRAPWVTQETMIAEMRLQWWRDALAEIRSGKGVRRHEVVTPLAAILDANATEVLDTLIEARRWDIYKDPFEDQQHLERYLAETAGGLMLVGAHALGQCAEGVARDVGYALGVANWLMAIPALEDANRVPLVNGRPEAVAEFAQGALSRLEAARQRRKEVDRAAGQAFYAAWQAEMVLKQAIADPRRVSNGALGSSEFGKRVGLMRRAFMGRW